MWGGVKVKHFCAMGEQLHTVGRRPHTRLCLSLLPPCVVQVASAKLYVALWTLVCTVRRANPKKSFMPWLPAAWWSWDAPVPRSREVC